MSRGDGKTMRVANFSKVGNSEKVKVANLSKVGNLDEHKIRRITVQTMSKEIKSKIVPRLRFPEFKGSEEWGDKALGKIGEIITGKTPSTKDKDLWDGKILFITPTDIEEGTKYQFNTQRKIVKLPSTKVLPIGSIVYTCIASIGKIAITSKPSTTNQQINSIIVKDFIENEFVYYSLVSITPYIKSKPATSTLPIINKTEFSEITIKFPRQKSEQQKIASCLSSLDEYITAEGEKLEALKTHKKGLMQQLFPAEGERVPKLRFPTFKDSGEWEEKSLGEVAEIKRGAASQHLKYITDNSSGIRLLRINDFLSNSPVYVENTEDMKRFTVKTNDLLIAGTGATAGIIFMVPEKFNNLAYSYNAPRIRIYKENSFFIYEYLKSDSILQQQQKFFVGNAQPFLDTKAIANLKVNVPTLAEQQKIASCLSSLDDLITSQTEKIEALKVHKKGLMQGLFIN